MTLAAQPRKVLLAVHLAASVGWLGAVLAYVVLDVAVASGSDVNRVRGAWQAMDAIVSTAILPLALASLATGVLIAVWTRWGLLRHWWVVISLALTSLATVVLIQEVAVVHRLAAIAADPATDGAEVLALPDTLVHSVGGAAILLVVQVLNVLKPSGVTPYGWRLSERDRRTAVQRRRNTQEA